MQSRIVSIIAAIALAVTLAVPANAKQYAINDYPATPSNASRVSFTESADMAANNSARGAVRFLDNTYESYTCKNGFTGRGCELTDSRFRHTAEQILPVCQTETQEDCVVSLTGKFGEVETQAEFLGYAGGDRMPAEKRLGLYEASNVSLWRIPGLIHEGGTDTYAVNLRGIMVYDRGSKRFFTNELDASVHPYLLEEGNGFSAPYSQNGYNEILNKNQSVTFGPGNCVWSDAGKCGRERAYTPGTEIQLVAKVSSNIAGWFRGRMKDPTIAIERFSASNNLLTIRAQAVDVARFSVLTTRETTSDRAFEILRFTGGNGFGVFNGSHKLFQANASQNADSFTIASEFRELANDTSAGISSLWSFSTIPTEASNRCLSDRNRVLGIVTTNATVYDGTVPEFRRGFLSYKLAGMHYHADGTTEVQGTYDLVMRSDVARCLYTFNRAPVSASITISGEGDKSIATTVVGEKNGWLKLAAYGFTFSNKTVRVKLTQKKTSITCVSTSDSKKTRKVTAFEPKCPRGFQKR